MTTSRERQLHADGPRDPAIARLEAENAQLRHAVASHAVVDQAIGVLTAVYRFRPAAGFEILREISQRTNTKLHTIAEAVIRWALGEPLPGRMEQGLRTAVRQRACRQDAQSGRPDRH
ncbi:ANTAR domain-containing protein [Streptomyces sp. NPDC005907]|uniref:ANTAR domain-containing protein n=1 Tax=Streptomyces sp. NPDC005907 TaxID=3154571 RepID=UPI00340939DA